MITAIVLTKNSQDSLPACLESLSFADEIIVADDRSLDQTHAIAVSYSAKILTLTATPSFSDKRNQALQKASHDWILFVDADEVVSAKLQLKILAVIKNQDEISGYYMKRNDIFLGKKLKHGETGNMWLLRLGKKGTGEWKRTVHEYWDIQGKTGRLSGELIHTAHPSIESFLEKINRYTELEAKERVQRPGVRGQENTKTLLQLFVYPPAKFVHNYIFRLGFLDGFPGFVMAWMMSLHSLCVRIKLLESKD